jgi:hypothetical protein
MVRQLVGVLSLSLADCMAGPIGFSNKLHVQLVQHSTLLAIQACKRCRMPYRIPLQWPLQGTANDFRCDSRWNSFMEMILWHKIHGLVELNLFYFLLWDLLFVVSARQIRPTSMTQMMPAWMMHFVTAMMFFVVEFSQMAEVEGRSQRPLACIACFDFAVQMHVYMYTPHTCSIIPPITGVLAVDMKTRSIQAQSLRWDS